MLTRRAPRARSAGERPVDSDAAVRRLAALLRRGTFNVVLTGAGVSTESGLPDFRSKGGLWSGIDPARVASLSAFQSDPQAFYAFYQTRLAGLAGAAPNAAHRAIARLEALGAVHLAMASAGCLYLASLAVVALAPLLSRGESALIDSPTSSAIGYNE